MAAWRRSRETSSVPICCDALDCDGSLAPPLEEPPHVSADGAAVETAPAAGDTDDEVGAEAGEDDRTSSQVVNDW